MSALLIINNQALDLPEDFSVKLNREIADIREPEKRSGDWSKTVTIPCTSNNKKIFTHIFDLQVNIQASGGQYTYSFNPNKKADITYLHNDITQLDGFLRLIQIKETDSHEIYFECSLHGKQVDLFTTLRGRTMSELDFTQYNHALTRTNVRNSWDTSIIKNASAYVNFSGGVPTGEGYVYPLIDYGTLPNFTYVSLREMFPALYAREVMSAIFASAGYTWTSDSFFNEEIFKRLIIPNTTGMQLSLADIEERLFAAGASANTMLQIGNTVTMNDDSTGSFYDNGGNYTASGSTFTSPVGGTYDFLFNAIGTFTPSGYSPGIIDPASMNVNLGLYVNDVFTRNLTLAFLVGSAGTPVAFNETLRADNIRVPDGATVKIKLQSVRDVNNNVSLVDADFGLEIAAGTYWANRVSAGSWGFNHTVDFTAFFEDDAKQLDFVLGMVRMFNLYVDVDPTSDKTLIIKTRDSYYNSTVRDWTNKRDYSRELEIIPMGELDANRYYFTYKQGDDDGNKEYTAKYNGRNYGDKLFVVDNDFVKDTKKIEVPFMPTTITPITTDKKVPYISVDGNNKGGGIHILYYKGLVSCQLWTLLNEPISNGYANYDQLTTFPYSGHLDDTTAPTIDLNFGMPFEVNLPAGVTYTNNNLFNHYWRSYIESITDINSKIVRGYFYITPADYQQLSFSDLFYFDNQFFRLNKIIDFDPSTDDITQCEFLLLQQVPAFTAETGLTGYGYNELDTYGNKFPDSIDPKFRNGGISQGGILGGGSDSNTGGGDGQLVLSKNSNANGGTSVLIAGGEEVVLPIALNNVVTLNCTAFTPATSGVFVYNQEFTQADAISDASIQEHTAGANVTINNNTSTLWVNPASALAALAITMPSTPYEGQECLIVFGGTITSGAVVTSVSMDADVLGGSSFTTANVGDALRLKYLSSITKWIRF